MLSNEQGCGYFSKDGQSITINQPDCVAALGKPGLGRWSTRASSLRRTGGEKIQSNNAGSVASQLYGAWYEGSIRTNVPEDQKGKWGVYHHAEHEGRPARGQPRRLVARHPGVHEEP